MMRQIHVQVSALDPDAAMVEARKRVEYLGGFDRYDIVECWAEPDNPYTYTPWDGTDWKVHVLVAERATPRVGE